MPGLQKGNEVTIYGQTDRHAYAFPRALLSRDMWDPAYQEGSSHTRTGLFNYRGEDTRRKVDKQDAATHAVSLSPGPGSNHVGGGQWDWHQAGAPEGR